MNTKTVAILVLVVLSIVFVLQNTHVVEFQFLFWKIGASRALLPVIFIAIGIFIGLFLKTKPRQKS
jgi:uncharacterized integral membrane protein